MTVVADTVDVFLSMFERIERRKERSAWLAPVRKAAISRFAELGWPTTADEEWRFTNVAPIAETTFEAPPESAVAGDRLQESLFNLGGPRIVLVNGRFAPELSSLSVLPRGVRVMSLREAIEREDETVRGQLARHTRHEHEAFAALNTALVEDGAVVEIGRGCVVEDPIEVTHVSAPGRTPWAAQPRTLIVAGESSQAAIVENFVSTDGGVYFNNAVTEIAAMENAVVDHHKITRESDDAFHIGTLHIHQYRSSNVHSFVGSFGGGLVRHNIHTVLDGEGCDCGLNGLYMVHGSQHVDNHLKVEHAKPHCDSREFFKGILDGKGKGIFSGRIIVRPNAQKTDAKQTNMSLLMSDEAQVESKPQLEIFADDVKCTHGATIGQINSDALFYLRSRGLGPEASRAMLVYAFANEVLERIKIEPLRRVLEELVIARLPHGGLLQGIP